MRSIVVPRSALRMPFNFLLGTEARVRVLRELAFAERPLGLRELAARAGLNERGVRTVVDGLREWGAVEMTPPPRLAVALATRGPLLPALQQLFHAERARADRIFDRIATACKSVRPPLRATWMYGPVAAGEDVPADPVLLAVLGEESDLSGQVDMLREALEAVETEEELTIDIRGFTVTDVKALEGRDVALARPVQALNGTLPPGLAAPAARTRRSPGGHGVQDAQALALGIALAQLVRRDPSIVERAAARIERRLAAAPEGLRPALAEWRSLLRGQSAPRLARLLEDPGERMTRLRQSLPLLDVLTAEERRTLAKLQTPERPR